MNHHRLCNQWRHQSGVALIMAILMVVLATLLAIGLATESYMDQRRTSNTLVMEQAWAIALAAEAGVTKVLQEERPSNQDHFGQVWHQPIEYALDDGIGAVRISIEDLQARFNLNSVLKPDGTPDEGAILQFKRLLEIVSQQSGVALDPAIAERLEDWLDADNNVTFPDGAEDGSYTANDVPYQPPNLPITRASELMSLKDFKPQMWTVLQPFVTALPLDAALNTCTASDIVFNSLSPGRIQQFSNTTTTSVVSSNNNKCLHTKTDTQNIFGGDPEFQKRLTASATFFGEESHYFRATIVVTLGTTELALYSVFHRNGSGKNAELQVIQRSTVAD